MSDVMSPKELTNITISDSCHKIIEFKFKIYLNLLINNMKQIHYCIHKHEYYTIINNVYL